MEPEASPLDLARNPFLVLELTPAATDPEVERQYQRLAGLLRIGAASAARYETPWGSRPRDTETLRTAVFELRRPERRLLHEILYQGVRMAHYVPPPQS